jgi:hypothetical protein
MSYALKMDCEIMDRLSVCKKGRKTALQRQTQRAARGVADSPYTAAARGVRDRSHL